MKHVTYSEILAALNAGQVVHVSGRIEMAGNPPTVRGVIDASYQVDEDDAATSSTITRTCTCEVTAAQRVDLLAHDAVDDGFIPPGTPLRCEVEVNPPSSKWELYAAATMLRGGTLPVDPSGHGAEAAARACVVALHAAAGEVLDPASVDVKRVGGS
jgi:hypothetical protein